jgi:hypothetical protein
MPKPTQTGTRACFFNSATKVPMCADGAPCTGVQPTAGRLARRPPTRVLHRDGYNWEPVTVAEVCAPQLARAADVQPGALGSSPSLTLALNATTAYFFAWRAAATGQSLFSYSAARGAALAWAGARAQSRTRGGDELSSHELDGAARPSRRASREGGASWWQARRRSWHSIPAAAAVRERERD